MRWISWLTFSLLLLTGLPAMAQDKKEEAETTQEKTASEDTFESLKAEFEKIESDWMDERGKIIAGIQSAEDQDARMAAIEKMQSAQVDVMKKQDEVAAKIVGLLDKVESKEDSFDMLVWLVENLQGGEGRGMALERLTKDHADNEKILQILPSIEGQGPSQSSQAALETLSEKGGSDSIKGAALLSLAKYLHQYKSLVADIAQMGDEAPPGIPKEEFAYFKKLAETTTEQIEALFTKAVDNYGDVKIGDATVSEIAKAKLKIIETQKNLEIGKVAPDIVGPDIDGESFKLSDYRGKVVMLDFWGHW